MRHIYKDALIVSLTSPPNAIVFTKKDDKTSLTSTATRSFQVIISAQRMPVRAREKSEINSSRKGPIKFVLYYILFNLRKSYFNNKMFSLLPISTSARACNILPKVVSMQVRNFQPRSDPTADDRYRGETPRRWGYEAHHHERGLLPRLKIKEKRLPTLPISSKEDEWSKRRATEGQNDFIRVLGGENIEQHELLTHIPDWLRGYRNTDKEYSVLQLRRREFSHWRYTKPLKWLHLEQRIKFLYRRINNKYKPPDVEKLNKSRHQL